MDILAYWQAVLQQNASAMSRFFAPAATVKWHNTNEEFTADEFILANCKYPGSWDGAVERMEHIGDLLITVAHVFPRIRG